MVLPILGGPDIANCTFCWVKSNTAYCSIVAADAVVYYLQRYSLHTSSQFELILPIQWLCHILVSVIIAQGIMRLSERETERQREREEGREGMGDSQRKGWGKETGIDMAYRVEMGDRAICIERSEREDVGERGERKEI